MIVVETVLLLAGAVLHLLAVGVVITHHVKMTDETGTMTGAIETATVTVTVSESVIVIVTGPAALKTESEI